MITIDEIERWGDDIESAVNLALVELKATREEVEVEVLEQPTKGFFGIGSKLAHVKVTRKQKAVEEKAPEKKEEPRKVITKDTIRKDAPAYDPSEDEPQDVYGPGPDLEDPDDTQDENTSNADESAEPEYVPQFDDVPTVYGPPADMDN